MPTLQEYLSNPKNESGFFNPDTGEFVFAENHAAANALQKEGDLGSVLKIIEDLKAKEKDIKDKMGEARKPEITPEQRSDGGYVQKGKSGNEMMDTAEGAAGTTLKQVQDKLTKYQALATKLGNEETVKRYKSGEFMLKVGNQGWEIWTIFPDKLNTEYSKRFLSNMQSIIGGNLNIIVKGQQTYILNATTAKTIEDFVAGILKKNASILTSVSLLWLSRKGFKRVKWYD